MNGCLYAKELGNCVTEFDFPYYNVVDQIYHAEWTAAKVVRLELLRESIATLWPNGHPTRLIHVQARAAKARPAAFWSSLLARSVGRARL